ncbi:T cell receptor beta chain MC.7.G5-like [Salvelinus fontinalis]|uniref:T cell receptor beta chain MC.7.G5-like n=1 Tax=Salvelinus fontinalis TaxID=8038 RepID=UPI00248634D0|nr:T cell receptor beta chain MC.7.G5-like [Salvelinus fontinalis]
MSPTTYGLGLFFILFPPRVKCAEFHQSPSLTVKERDRVEVHCSHNDNNLVVMLWYQQKQASPAMTLIGYGYSATEPNYEGLFQERFQLKRADTLTGSLVISNITSADSAVYFCAASHTMGGVGQAYFGGGTRLTVLEPGLTISPPKVKVLPPSTKECEDRNKKKKKTLVCVATDFYPDHVTVFWQLNGGANITDGVGTDNTALSGKNKLYSITSRLRVPAKKWNKASNRFTCTVRFFNGTTDIYVADHINGEEGQGGDGGITTEYYVRSTKTAKLAYSIFIAKSTFYGLVVMALIWKFQRSSDKQM